MKRSLALIFVAFLLIPLTMIKARAADTAADMRLEASRGTVSVTDGKDKEVTVSDGMRLFDGYTLKTGAASGAWISLDRSKAVRMDADSHAKINKAGDKLSIDLEAGNLLVNVSTPLRPEESFEIRTSTTITGVRGTVLSLRQLSDGSSNIYVLEGSVSVSMTKAGPGTSVVETVTVGVGQVATLTMVSGTPEVENELDVREFSADEVDGFVREEISTNAALAKRLALSESSEVRKLVGPAYARLKLTAGDAADVTALEEALEEEPYLVVEITDVESMQPGTDVELGANQSIKLTGSALDLLDDSDSRCALTNEGTIVGDSESDIWNVSNADNAGVIKVKGSFDAEQLTNTGTVDIGSADKESVIAVLQNDSGGVINIYGILIISSLNNSGVINILNGGVLRILSDGLPPSVNQGEIAIIEGALYIDVDASLDNAGEIDNDDAIYNSGAIINESGATITNDGQITNDGTIENTGAIDGDGTLTGNDVVEP